MIPTIDQMMTHWPTIPRVTPRSRYPGKKFQVSLPPPSLMLLVFDSLYLAAFVSPKDKHCGGHNHLLTSTSLMHKVWILWMSFGFSPASWQKLCKGLCCLSLTFNNFVVSIKVEMNLKLMHYLIHCQLERTLQAVERSLGITLVVSIHCSSVLT